MLFICSTGYIAVLKHSFSRSISVSSASETLGARPRGRPKKTWREIVEKDCRARGLNTEDAMCRSRWRKQIGMIDDHDECSG